MASFYPVMLKLSGEPVLVVGGGSVAERKIASLLEADARVTVISPAISDRIELWKKIGKVSVYCRKYASGDARCYRIVFAATNDAAINEQIAAETHASNSWVNVAGDQHASSFIDPAVMKRGRLQLSVSTGGASPALAADIKQQLAEHYGEEYEFVLDFLYMLRTEVKARFTDDRERRAIFRYIAKIDWIQHYQLNGCEQAIEAWLRHFEAWLDEQKRVEGKDES